MNTRRFGITIALFLVPLVALRFSAQQGPVSPAVIQINVGLVQVDAVVTDSKGNPVKDLKAEDFEILQDGKPQAITNFEFVDVKAGVVARGAAPRIAAPRGNSPPAPPPPGRPLRPEQIRRTIAIVVDDLGLSFDSISRVQGSLKKWLDNEMRPGDLVAVIRTSAGMGSLQQFTNDKRALRAAIDLVRYHVGRVGTSSFAALEPLLPAGSIDTTAFNQELSQRYSIGSMGAIQYVVQGLRDVPGRKSLILFSESLQFTQQGLRNQEVEERLRRLADAANRSSVVIYGIDPRGVIYTGLTAEDNVGNRSPQQISQVFSDRSNQLMFSREGLQMLADRTGGIFLGDNNDISATLHKAVDDGDGYYLLAYQPETSTFGQPVAKFHSITVRLKRTDLKVRSRTGFFGTPDRPTAVPRAPIDQIRRALASPFGSGGVRVRLTTLYSESAKLGPYINALVHMDANDLTFNQDAEGFRTSVIDIAAVTFDAEGQQIDGASKTWRFRIDAKTHLTVIQNGLIYSIHVPVKKPGAYQMRVAVRDNGSQLLGSASQFVEVPDIKKGRLALSGILVAAEKDGKPPAIQLSEGPVTSDDSNLTPAVRIFKQGMTIIYAYEILNAKLDRNKKTQLEVQPRLFREGEEVFAGKSSPIDNEGQQDLQHMVGTGRMELTKLMPGDYVLQLIVVDKLAGEKYRIASQSMDFEVQQ